MVPKVLETFKYDSIFSSGTLSVKHVLDIHNNTMSEEVLQRAITYGFHVEGTGSF